MEDGRGSEAGPRSFSYPPRVPGGSGHELPDPSLHRGRREAGAAEAKQCRQLPKKRGPCVTGHGTASAGPNSAASSPGRRGPGLEPRPCVPRRPTFPRSPTARHLPRAKHRAQHLPCVNSGPTAPGKSRQVVASEASAACDPAPAPPLAGWPGPAYSSAE